MTVSNSSSSTKNLIDSFPFTQPSMNSSGSSSGSMGSTSSSSMIGSMYNHYNIDVSNNNPAKVIK